MVKTQVQLAEEDLALLRRLAAEQGVSVSELVRRGVRQMLRSQAELGHPDRWERACAAAGRFHSGKSDIAQRHDDYLAEDLQP